MENKKNAIVYMKNVVELVTIANEYCKFIENFEISKKKQFVEVSTKLLPFIYLKASMIPVFESDENDEIEEHVTETQYSYLHQQIAVLLDLHDLYITVNNHTSEGFDKTEEITMSECFADIYQDLKNFTENYRTGVEDVMYESLWQCCYNFRQYWGIRLIVLLEKLHNLNYGEEKL